MEKNPVDPAMRYAVGVAIGHFANELHVPVEDFARMSGIPTDRLLDYVRSNGELTGTEVENLSTLLGDLLQAEDKDKGPKSLLRQYGG